MFEDLLKEIIDPTHGAIAAMVMGFDGIAVDQYARRDSDVPVETVGLEYSMPFSKLREAALQADAGDTAEVVVESERVTAVLRLLNDAYFVVMVLAPDAHVGKARHLLRMRANALLERLI